MSAKRYLSRADSKPALSPLVNQIVHMTRRKGASVSEMATVLASDPALCSRLLSVVNSPKFDLVGECESVSDAAVLLGIERLKWLALAAGISSCVKAIEPMKLKVYWRNVFIIAQYATWLAELTGRDPEGAFLTALVHDLGTLQVAMQDLDSYRKIYRKYGNGDQRDAAERELLGCTIPELSALLAREWGLPERVVGALAWQRSPIRDDATNANACLLYLSVYLNYIRLIREDPKDVLKRIPETLFETLELDTQLFLQRLPEIDQLDVGFELLAA